MKTIVTSLLSMIWISGFAQKPLTVQPAKLSYAFSNLGKRDTTIESDTSKENKEPQYFYLSAFTNVFVNTKGGAAKRFAPAVEFGRTYGIFDIGLATGKLNELRGNDSARYIELRPTINVFSKGRFAESLCLGAGYVLSAKQALMSEICNGINFNVSTTFAIAIVQGYVFFDGTNSNRNGQYIGINLTYNFLKPHSVNKQRKKEAILSDK
ncbi:hypothetical protein [Mucilaginibacter gotjawali]|uniref:Uncharacterized protein n=2 Tax=Mucilaginibacter gotjawali TaxID=1550579 RepID=A0A0X8X0E2_9SPHI|nr:hypothetical protein [Mucilaginibacter gotjawali]MBB3055363.1 hypothetical protein [Mucilaginibacter gotjawali]BAU53360.1 hypothetical protein MgSA37_01527 [Mucilaginibacter gotjawali]